MQKVKQIFSSHDDADRTDIRPNSGSDAHTSSLGSGNPAHNDTTTGIHSIGLKSHPTGTPAGSTGLGGSSEETRGVGEQGLGRDPVAGSTGHGTVSNHGLTSNTSGSVGSTGQRESLTSKFTGKHTFGHDNRTDSKFDPTGENTSHDHKHLQAVTHNAVRHQEVEEVQREREHHRHVHHLQHHVQPVHDTHVKDEVHHHNVVPVTNITEKHANTEEDVKLFHSLGEKHRDEERHLPKERTVVDLGEKVNEITHHHVHHVTQPVVEREIHDKHRIHTTIPLTHTVHEAPIIHKSSVHEPVHLSDFLKGGGKLDSGITHDKAGILSSGECDRSVDGVGEKLAQELNLKPSTFGHNSSSTTGSTGLTGSNAGSTGLTGSNTGSHSLTGNNTTGSSLTGNHSSLTGNNTTGSGFTRDTSSTAAGKTFT